MSKAILISINPKHVANILNGKKKVELRTTAPVHCDYPIDVYIYVTSHKNYTQSLYECVSPNKRRKFGVDKYRPSDPDFILNGKVVAKFTLNKLEEVKFSDEQVQKQACVTEEELFDYLFIDTPYNEDMRKCYAWHIDNLAILRKPLLLKDFYKLGFEKEYNQAVFCLKNNVRWKTEPDYVIEDYRLTRAPQSWFYVEVGK